MAEAWGTVVISGAESILRDMSSDNNGVTWQLMTKLFTFAGFQSLKEANPILGYYENRSFIDEGIHFKDNHLIVDVFGDEWMFAIEELVTKGENLEVFGEISHEYGAKAYYALIQDGQRYFETIDYESDVNVEREEEIRQEWLKLIPESVRSKYE